VIVDHPEVLTDRVPFLCHLPECLQRAITCNMGMQMPGWYDIINMEGINSQEDDEGINASVQYVP
jgi:hypothetical protein